MKPAAPQPTRQPAPKRVETQRVVPSTEARAISSAPLAVARLQRAAGNRSVARLFAPTLQRTCKACEEEERVQAKLTVNQPGDQYELEADRVADRVMRMAEPSAALATAPTDTLQRKCSCQAADTDDCDRDTGVKALQRTAMSPASSMDLSSVHEALRSPGRPLDSPTRRFMENRFERDFASVRIHTGETAAASARAVNAQAYTVGSHIVFAAGRFQPQTDDGRRLIAHELTHTIQQSASPPRGSARAANVQRSPDPPPKQQRQPLIIGVGSAAPPLFFARPFHAEPIDLTKPSSVAGERFVTESNIVEWAAQHIFSNATLRGGSPEKDRLVKLLRRGNVADLHAAWRARANSTVTLVSPLGLADVSADTPPKVQVVYPKDNPFTGSEPARAQWAKYLVANWTQVETTLDDKVTDLYVERIKGALYTKLIPLGATLVKQSARVKQIEDAPENESVPLGRWNATARVGFEWMRKRMKSTSTSSVVFEVIGHEGVYFEISTNDFVKSDPFTGKVISDVVKNTKGIVIVGQFLKGFLNALAAPVVIVLDTAAKVLDMATMAVSAFGKWRGWYDVGYTCLSSTCRNYEACLGTKKTEDCKSEVLQQAVEEATIIIPIYRQGSECLKGDAEACGGIAALALGLVEGGVRKAGKGKLAEAEGGAAKGRQPMTRGEFEDALIRDAIDRPRAGEPSLGKVFEEPAAREKPSQSRLEIKKPSEPTPRAPTDIVTEQLVDERAARAGSEVKLGDGKHGVAAAGEGKRAGFRLCSSHCSLVADKLEQIEHVLPDKSGLRRDVNFLKRKVRGLDNEVKAGHLTQDMADRAARDIATGLRDSAGTPIIDTLLQMSVEDLQANRASLKKQISQALELGEEVSKEFAEAGKKGVRTELPEGTGASGTTTKPRTAVTGDAAQLAANLTKEVGPRPPGHEAHHIVPKGMQEAAEARRILEKSEIGINDAENGIWLPRDTAVPNALTGDIHSRVHTARAIRIMTEQLREGAKEGPAGVRRALRRIQLTLSDLKFER